MLQRSIVSTVSLMGLLLLAACDKPAPPRQVTVFAAASLTEAFNEAAARFAQTHPGVVVMPNFAGSQRLLAQLGLGAQADLFASASPLEMEAARQRGLLGGEPVIFAHNSLVIAVPPTNPAAITTPTDLARPGIRLILADAAVPAGAYSRAVLAKLDAAPDSPPDYQQRVLANVVSLEDDVKQVAAKIQLGEVDAGIIYATDAKAAKLPTIAIPPQYNEEAAYPIAILEGAKEQALAADFAAYLLSPEGQEILVRHGFGPAGPKSP